MLLPDNRDEFKKFSDPAPVFGPAPTALLEGLAQIPDCEIHIVCCVHRPMQAPEKLADNIWYHAVVVPRWGWRLAYLGCIWKLRRKLKALQPDLVHGQGSERYCAISAVFSGFRNLITLHGNMRAVSRALGIGIFTTQWLAARFETVALFLTNGVICLTTYTRQQVGNLSRRTWIVPNAVDSSFFTVPRRPEPIPLLLCVADAAVYKNQIRLIEALDQLAEQKGDPFQLLLAGQADEEREYGRNFLRLCSERSWCQHLGPQNKSALQRLLGRAAILVLPSTEDNCPMVILEAMAAGVPVAASRIGGIPDLIEEGVSGVLFDPTSPENIRDSINSLLSNPPAAQKMAEVARKRAAQRFAPIEVARRHLEIYREVLANP